MKICAVTFDYAGQSIFGRMASVLEYSAKKNCPRAQFELVKIPAPRDSHSKRWREANTTKMAEWLRVLGETDDDVMLMDCDMLILRDVSSAFDSDFDIGYTVRSEPHGLPMNGGVVFVKNTIAARKFMQLWKDVNDKMYADDRFHAQWRNKYAGMNQAAFGYLMERVEHGARLKKFHCSEWNAVSTTDWKNVDGVRVMHYKSGLRRMIANDFHPEMCEPKYRRAVQVWRTMYIESLSPSASQLMAKTITAVRKTKYSLPEQKIDLGLLPLDNKIVARRSTIFIVSKVLKRMMQPSLGICHGSGGGQELKWFEECIPGCEVIGTDCARGADKVKNTLLWDFCEQNPEWLGVADFVYSNSLSLAYDRGKAFRAWAEQLRPNGVMLLECQDFADDIVERVTTWSAALWKVVSLFELNGTGHRCALVSRSKAPVPLEVGG